MMQNKRKIQTVERTRCDAVIDWLLPIVVIWRKAIRQGAVEMAKNGVFGTCGLVVRF